jgi:hypothetical protein
MEYHGRKLVNLAWSQKNGEPHLSTFFFQQGTKEKKGPNGLIQIRLVMKQSIK